MRFVGYTFNTPPNNNFHITIDSFKKSQKTMYTSFFNSKSEYIDDFKEYFLKNYNLEKFDNTFTELILNATNFKVGVDKLKKFENLEDVFKFSVLYTEKIRNDTIYERVERRIKNTNLGNMKRKSYQ